VFSNVLTTSINNYTHIKRKNSKTICNSETISSRIFGSAPNSPNTPCHLCDLVGLHSHRRVHSAGSTFTFFKPANCTYVACIPHTLPRHSPNTCLEPAYNNLCGSQVESDEARRHLYFHWSVNISGKPSHSKHRHGLPICLVTEV
jgi:hypothetical protein